ncbi:MAG: hypothetical protein ACRDJY_05500 [Thermoleophilaceae bacterium]
MRLRIPRPRRPRVVDVLSFIISFVIALIGAIGVILFFESRDESQLEGDRAEPGQVYRGEPVLSPALEEAAAKGNVVVLYRDPKQPRGTEELAEGAGPSLEELGLAVVFEREPTLRTALGAIADDRIEYGDTPSEIRNFVDFHLGP